MRPLAIALSLALSSAAFAAAGGLPVKGSAMHYVPQAGAPPAACLGAGAVCTWYDNTEGAFKLRTPAGTDVPLSTGAYDPNTGSWVRYCAGAAGAQPSSNFTAGPFYQPNTTLGPALYEAVIKPENPSTGYVFSDGYGGKHSMLLGLNTSATPEKTAYLNGNVYTTDGIKSFESFGEICMDRWSHIAAYTDGATATWTYIKGVPVGMNPYSSTRTSPAGSVDGSGVLYICGSDHNNFHGYIASARVWEGTASVPSPVVTYPYCSFRPDKIMQQFGFYEPAITGYKYPVAAWDFSGIGAVIQDYGTGWDGGSGGVVTRHALVGNNATGGSGLGLGAISSAQYGHPSPALYFDRTSPVSVNAPADPGPSICQQSPTAPPSGAYVWDDFNRADSTLWESVDPKIGRTVGGTQGSQEWNVAPTTKGWGFGIINNQAIRINVAGAPNGRIWVDSGHNSYSITVKRKVALEADEFGCTGTGSVAGNCSGVGIVWRLNPANNADYCYTHTLTAPNAAPKLYTNCYVAGAQTGEFAQVAADGAWNRLKVVVDDSTDTITEYTCQDDTCTQRGQFTSTSNHGYQGVGIMSWTGAYGQIDGRRRWDNFCAGPIGGNC